MQPVKSWHVSLLVDQQFREQQACKTRNVNQPLAKNKDKKGNLLEQHDQSLNKARKTDTCESNGQLQDDAGGGQAEHDEGEHEFPEA
jgi:hypothetical protein